MARKKINLDSPEANAFLISSEMSQQISKSSSIRKEKLNNFISARKSTSRPHDLEVGDDVSSSYQGVMCIPPPINPENLIELLYMSSILRQCVDATVDGVFGKGYHLVLKDWLTKEQKEDPIIKQAIEKEKEYLKSFLEEIDIDGDSHLKFKIKSGKNYETTGSSYWEVIRSVKKENGIPSMDSDNQVIFENKIEGFNLLESINIRIVSISDWIPYVKNKSINGQIHKKTSIKRFKIFVQIEDPTLSYEMKKLRVYFKEFGDPRRVDSETGRIISDQEWNSYSDDKKRNFMPAHEVIHFKQYFPGTPYGVPKYVGTIQAIIGSILKEENDLKWFENGCKADLVITSESTLSNQSIDMVTKYVGDSSKIDNARKVLVLFPKQSFKLGDEKENAKFTIHEINQSRDAQWIQYHANNKDSVKQSFRISDLHAGMNKDFNRATSEVAQEVTEDNVFKPERDDFDYIFNKTIFPEIGVVYHDYESVPSTKDSIITMADAIYKLQYTGLTFREARKLIERVFGIDFEGLEARLGKDDTYWLDYPIFLAKEMFNLGLQPDTVDEEQQQENQNENSNQEENQEEPVEQQNLIEENKNVIKQIKFNKPIYIANPSNKGEKNKLII